MHRGSDPAGVGGGLFFDVGGGAGLAPLPVSLEVAEGEQLPAVAALALDLGDPMVFAGAESSDVCRDDLATDDDETLAVLVLGDFVGFGCGGHGRWSVSCFL